MVKTLWCPDRLTASGTQAVRGGVQLKVQGVTPPPNHRFPLCIHKRRSIPTKTVFRQVASIYCSLVKTPQGR